MSEEPQVTKEVLANFFEVDVHSEQKNDEELFNHLVDHIAYLLDHNRDFLMSLLYRLDVRESSIKAYMSKTDLSPAEVIARLIIERQIERIKTKQSYSSNRNIDPDIESW